MRDYSTKFFRLSTQNNLFEIESQLAVRFIGGLRPNIQDRLGVQDVWNLSEVIWLATKAETQNDQFYTHRQQPYK